MSPLWLFLFFRNSSGTLQPHHSSWGCAYLECEPFLLRRDMLCRGVNVRKKKPMTTGYFAYWTHMSFLWGDINLSLDTETPEVEIKWPVNRFNYFYLVMHLINTRLGAEDRISRLSKCKDLPLGHPPLALAAELDCSFGRTVKVLPHAYHATITRGVR